MGTPQGWEWICHGDGDATGMGTPWGWEWRCHRDGDTTGIGTLRTPLCWRGRGQAEPQGLLAERGPGCLGSPSRSPGSALTPGAPPGGHPRVPHTLLSPGRCPPHPTGDGGPLPGSPRPEEYLRGGRGPQPRAPTPTPEGEQAAPLGTICPGWVAGPTAAFWVDLAGFGARSHQWRPGSPREGGARATGANRF